MDQYVDPGLVSGVSGLVKIVGFSILGILVLSMLISLAMFLWRFVKN